MKCDLCQKKATVHLTEIVDDQMTEMHLCEDCAKDKSVQMEQQFGLADLLAGLTDLGKQQKETGKKNKTCPNCGLAYEDFRKFGRLGCAHCYDAFQENLDGLLKKIHGSNKHLGKKSKETKSVKKSSTSKTSTASKKSKKPETQKETVAKLKDELKQAIAQEDFEKAAEIRDRIKDLKAKES